MNLQQLQNDFSRLQITESPLCIKQFRFPRSKSRRIRKKWAKNKSNFKPALYRIPGTTRIIMHPSFVTLIREFEAKTKKDYEDSIA